MLPDMIRPFMAAILGPILAFIFAWIIQHTGLAFTPEQLDTIQNTLIAISSAWVLGVFINKKANPVQAATTDLAAEGKELHHVVQASRAMARNAGARETDPFAAPGSKVRGAAHPGLVDTDLHVASARGLNLPKIPLSDAQKRQLWDLLRPHQGMRIYIRDIIPNVPFIGGWSVGLGGLLTKLIGPDPASGI